MSPPIEVALLALPQSTAATLFGIYDILASVRRDWSLVHGEAPQASPFRPLIVSPDGQPLDATNGVRITPHRGFGDCGNPAVVIVADLMVAPDEAGEGFEASIEWLLECHRSGAMLASACSGAILLARTGLLDGREATSHWAYCDHLQRLHPRTRWHADRGLVATGPANRILMAGSGVSWHMLALALVARHAGPEEAMRVARINLMDLQAASPLAYASLTHGGHAADPAIERAQRWASQNYACTDAPVAEMARTSGMTERTFKRRFAAATGMAPLEYIHHVRLEEAKHLLESGDTAVEAIAFDVGYSDNSFFTRLFKRKVGMTPARYRQRFGTLAREIAASAGAGDPG
ncbi:helix-turn-helix domain-containing protein [Ottowia sp.]|jgi:transcriptional regulator GlxA family with amidase domain|uniref:GlxA family transcriptional regulator n=1 Tax=Ottowia sp. TaxID=1898956 RepID=UPI0025DEDC49|nr:helix-turn-helix domain-containing protein [Ottowia sp.]MBK6614950.1 helix-turn-helix domain-containing protein [Ottowia sp.]MBK6746031.1 helix-turn-helix domain-containing protein [Ottowia sp.]